MSIKSIAAGLAARVIRSQVYSSQQQAVNLQHKLLIHLIKTAEQTEIGKKYGFSKVKNYDDFKKAVPVIDYEDLKDEIELIADGKQNVLWPGLPLYFCKSSGTTSGTKYIPVSRAQIGNMITSARNATMLYVSETNSAAIFNHKMIFLQGSPELEKHGQISTGRLSGIVYHHVPSYAQSNRMPSYALNCIEDWEEKVEAIAKETLKERMSLISGIPPWCVMYFEKLLELSGKQTIKEVFPDFKVFMYGGVNYEPYRHKIENLIGFKIDSVETYPASEGFIAYQDSQQQEGMLLNIDGGLFYEFVKAQDISLENPERISLQDVELGVNYALLLSTNSGLWAYNIGDTVKFVSKNPYRIVVTGRTKHFISAFGEHVIGEEVEFAILRAMRDMHCGVTEFTVAPQVNPAEGLPYHEWFVEFSKPPASINAFAGLVDKYMRGRNAYYDDLRKGHIIQPLKLHNVKPGTFVEFMKGRGKLGGQNKVPRLTNDRSIADELVKFL
ncbi:MAG: GH3 auxin-responsive promoter family protein [Chitinophagales bacterium]